MGKVTPEFVLQPICWLIGKWVSVKACGQYPGFKPFKYCDIMEFKSFGQPLLQYKSKTFLKNKELTKKHYECGFLKVKPCSRKLSFLLAHNFGLTSVEEGEVCDRLICLKSSEISRMSFAREPAVCELHRQYKLLDDGKLEMIIHMATNCTPLTQHLYVIYERDD